MELSQPFSKDAAEVKTPGSDPIIRLLRELSILMSLLIPCTRSISHLSLAFSYLTTSFAIMSDSADNGGAKDLGISDDWIADNVAFQTRSSHSVWQTFICNLF